MKTTLQKNTGGLDFKTILAYCPWRCKLQKARNSRIFHVQNFQTVEQWAKYIEYLDNNDTAYDAFFEGKKYYRLEKSGLMFDCKFAKLYIVQSEIREKSMTILTNIGTKTNAMVGLRCLE